MNKTSYQELPSPWWQHQELQLRQWLVKQHHPESDMMTPEALWAMGRIGGAAASPDGKQIVYQVGYYSVEQNKGHQILYVINADGKTTVSSPLRRKVKPTPAGLITDRKIAFLCDGQLWEMNPDGTGRKQLTKSAIDIEGYKFSPDGKQVIFHQVDPHHGSIRPTPADLPLASGRVVTDMNYRHWDHYVESITHPYVAKRNGWRHRRGHGHHARPTPWVPAGSIRRHRATGLESWLQIHRLYLPQEGRRGLRHSTDADIYLYNIATKETSQPLQAHRLQGTSHRRHQNYEKSGGEQSGRRHERGLRRESEVLARRQVTWFGRAWSTTDMRATATARASTHWQTETRNTWARPSTQRGRLLLANDLQTLYSWVAGMPAWTVSDESGRTSEAVDRRWNDYGSVQLFGNTKKLLTTRHSISHPDDIFIVTPAKKEKKSDVAQVTDENKQIFDQLEMGKIEERWVKTTDGKQEQVWIILPPHLTSTRNIPHYYIAKADQSPVSQFWSYRWTSRLWQPTAMSSWRPTAAVCPDMVRNGMKKSQATGPDNAWTTICRPSTTPPPICLL